MFIKELHCLLRLLDEVKRRHAQEGDHLCQMVYFAVLTFWTFCHDDLLGLEEIPHLYREVSDNHI